MGRDNIYLEAFPIAKITARKSSSKAGGNITTPSDHTVHWATARLRQRPSFRWTKGQSCTNFQIGPLKWGCSYADAPLHVLADPGQLESAILNLVLNANNAMHLGGTIKIDLSCDADEKAHISVIDTGVGMSLDVQQKAIEPFFTTRSAEGGTGLGLSIVYGFITQSGGSMDIESRKGKGTHIHMTLPLVNQAATPAHTSLRSALLVDDNPKDRKATEIVLTTLGYETTLCPSYKTATKALMRQKPYDLVISDFDLGPGPSGLDFLKIAQRQLSMPHCVLISGKTIRAEALPPDVIFQSKPVSQDALISAITKLNNLNHDSSAGVT